MPYCFLHCEIALPSRNPRSRMSRFITPLPTALDKLFHQVIKHRTFMIIARDHPHGHKEKEIQRRVRVQQRHHLIAPPPLTAALLIVGHLAVLLFRNGMIVLVKEKLDRTLIAGVVRNKQVGGISDKNAFSIKSTVAAETSGPHPLQTISSRPGHPYPWPPCVNNPDHKESPGHSDSSG